MSIRILIADDHGVLRAGLRYMLTREPDLEVVGEAVDGHEALRLAGELRPDVVLLDISMPGPDGIQVARQLSRVLPEARVLILTMSEDEDALRKAIEAGVAGYVPKRALESELINAVRAVVNGHLYIHHSMTRAFLRGSRRAPLIPDMTPVESLTPRETEVLTLLAQGHTNRQVAEILVLSVRTVEKHRANVTSKLGMRSRVELVRYAKEHGLLD